MAQHDCYPADEKIEPSTSTFDWTSSENAQPLNGPWVIYIRLNFNFYVDDDCTGLTAYRDQSGGVPQKEAFDRARELVEDMNDFLEAMGNNTPNNQSFHGAQVTQPQFVHHRFIVDDVRIWCDTEKRSGSLDDYAFTLAGNDDVISVNIANFPGGDGQASRSLKYNLVENYSPSNLYHEILHNFTLWHPFDGSNTNFDGCLDTWHFPWTVYTPNDDPGTPSFGYRNCWRTSVLFDINNDSINENLCDLSDPLVAQYVDTTKPPHLCCSQEWQNNNILGYGLHATQRDKATITPCQMSTTLNLLLDPDHRLNEVVASEPHGCPPVSAIIGRLPTFDQENAPCWFPIYLGASMGGTSYSYSILRQSAGTTSQIFSSGQQDGNPDNVVLGFGQPVDPSKPWLTPVDHHLTAGDYIILFSIQNECNSYDLASLSFHYPEHCIEEQDDQGPGGPFEPEIGERGNNNNGGKSATKINATAFPNPVDLESRQNVVVRVGVYDTPLSQVAYTLYGYDIYGNFQRPTNLRAIKGYDGGHELVIDHTRLVKGMNYIRIVTPNDTEIIKIQAL